MTATATMPFAALSHGDSFTFDKDGAKMVFTKTGPFSFTNGKTDAGLTKVKTTLVTLVKTAGFGLW